jgi:hypothetical protein
MHETKLLKLLGISLIVGILGLTGFCKKSEDNNDLALGAGLVVAQQQAEQAAYEAANNTDNPQWFCAIVTKFGTTYNAMITPLVAQDCNLNYWGSSTNAIKQRLLEKIDGDADLRSNCSNTRNVISNFDFSSGIGEEKFKYVNGSSLLSEVGLDPTTYTVVSPNTYKLFYLLKYIKNIANDTDPNTPGNQNEASCQTAVQNKIDSIPDSNKFCSNTALSLLSIPACDSSSGKTKAVVGVCKYGSGVANNDPLKCATLND